MEVTTRFGHSAPRPKIPVIHGWPGTGVSGTQEGHIEDVLPAVIFWKDLLTILEIKPSLLSVWAERSRSPGTGSRDITVRGICQDTHSAYPLLTNRDGVKRKHSTLHKSDILLGKLYPAMLKSHSHLIYPGVQQGIRLMQSFPLPPSYLRQI